MNEAIERVIAGNNKDGLAIIIRRQAKIIKSLNETLSNIKTIMVNYKYGHNRTLEYVYNNILKELKNV